MSQLELWSLLSFHLREILFFVAIFLLNASRQRCYKKFFNFVVASNFYDFLEFCEAWASVYHWLRRKNEWKLFSHKSKNFGGLDENFETWKLVTLIPIWIRLREGVIIKLIRDVISLFYCYLILSLKIIISTTSHFIFCWKFIRSSMKKPYVKSYTLQSPYSNGVVWHVPTFICTTVVWKPYSSYIIST